MKRLMIASLLAGGLLGGSAFAVAAQEPADAIDTADAASVAVDETADPKLVGYCLQHTGSRIPVVERRVSGKVERDKYGRRCIAASGRVYTDEDLRRTGEIDLAAALRKLSPVIH